MKDSCGFTSDEIQEFLDGALSPERTRSLALHLRDCPLCTERLEGFETVDRLLRDLETLPVPGGLHGAILSAVRAQPAPARWPRLAATAALVVLSALVVGWFFGPGLEVGPLTEARTEVHGALGAAADSLVSADYLRATLAGLGSTLDRSALDSPLGGWPLLALFLASLAVALGLNLAAFRRMRRGSL